MNMASRRDDFVLPTSVWGSLFYYDEQLQGKDVMILSEVIEHIEEYRLPRVMDTIFGSYQPNVLLITNQNVEYNTVYEMDNEQSSQDRLG